MKRIAVVLGVMFAFTAHAGIWENGGHLNAGFFDAPRPPPPPTNGINLNGAGASTGALKVQNATARNGKLFIRVAK